MNTNTMNSGLINIQAGSKELDLTHYPARARFILKMLANLQHGALHLELPDGKSAHFGDDTYPVTLRLHNW